MTLASPLIKTIPERKPMIHMKDLTLQQKVGQRLMVGFDGTKLNEDLKFLVDTLHVGGIILFKRNIETPDQAARLCRAVQEYARSRNLPPLFIAIDQEGGKVARLSPPFTQFPGNPHMKTAEDAVIFSETTARELHQIGVNMNYAPVMDVAPKYMNSIMADRAFGDDPVRVSVMGSHVIGTLQAKNIMAVAKHFPGIGRTTLDSHLVRPVFDAELSDMASYDLIPFEAAVKADVSGIMLSHILYEKIDAEWPAGLSVKIAKDLLRSRMSYNGLVMTDDLDMGAIKKYYDLSTVIDRVLSADIDQILICHKGPDIQKAFDLILERLEDPAVLKSADLSLKRIFSAKQKYLGYGDHQHPIFHKEESS